jgi:hypothetical protein
MAIVLAAWNAGPDTLAELMARSLQLAAQAAQGMADRRDSA